MTRPTALPTDTMPDSRNAAPPTAKPCETMEDVRREIDRIDRALVRLMAERLRYIEEAARIKPSRDRVRDTARIEDVVAKVLAEAERQNLSPEVAEPVWRLLIERSIAHEYERFDAEKGA